MEGNYYSDGKNRFYRLEAGTEEHFYEIRMINNNQPDMLLRLHPAEDGQKSYYDYNVSGLQALSACDAREIQENYLYSIVFSMERLSELADAYLLDPKDISLDPERIFLRRESGQVYFLYYPGQEGSLQEHIRELMAYFMKTLDPTDEEGVLLLYGLYQKSREEGVMLDTLAGYWREHQTREREAVHAEGVVEDRYGENEREAEEEPVYAELGLEKSTKGRAYSKWRANRVIERETAAAETVEIAAEIPASMPPDERSETKPSFLSRLKDYALEIGVGIVVAAGALIILLT